MVAYQSDKKISLIQPPHFRGKRPRCKGGTLDLSCGVFKRESEVDMEEDDDGGLFNIEVSSDESVNDSEKVPRDFQSEEDFQRQKKEWKPKVEKGEIWKTLQLPIDNPSKPESQTILHAIEELYFFRRYEEARQVASDVLKGKLNDEFRNIIEDYKARCEAKVRERGK